MKGLVMLAALAVPPSAFAEVPDGTVLFVENSSFLVESVTAFETTHVAIILDGKVYQAEPPKVRTYTIAEYFGLIAKDNGKSQKCKTIFCQPKNAYKQEQIAAMRVFLEAEVGRRYSVKGYLKGNESDGTHCAQLVTEALVAADKVTADKPWMVSPGALRLSVEKFCYTKGCYLVEKKKTNLARRFSDWLYDKGTFCSWSCYETWAFCR